MIVRILSCGTSFKGLSTYLTHDPDAKTKERVAWTHTLNLAHDHIPSAVDEMLWTARDAELLKQEAGIRAGGRATENSVKHISLNWHPDENPTREHMIESAEDFLRAMKWHEHQTVLVAHDDKSHAHVHLMINAVNPETGLHLDDNFERRRAQAWALGYEREQGRIYCEQRLLTPEEREDALPRNAWMAFHENQKKFERDEKLIQARDGEFSEIRENEMSPHAEEWKKLKEIQKRERMDFFADGKSAFSELRREIYAEIREEFRDRWAEFYQAKKNGLDAEALALMKAELVAEQKAALDSRRDAGCGELREHRNELYRELLDGQREIRFALHNRQEAGFDNSLFLHRVEELGFERPAQFQDAADAITQRDGEEREPITADGTSAPEHHERTGMKSEADIGANVATGLGFGVLSIFDSIADGLIAAKPAPKPRRQEPDRPAGGSPFDDVIAEARKRQQTEQEEADREWRKKQRGDYGE
jgi:hypothetical protein